MNYKIGQILFVVLKKQSQVFPMQCIEIITKKTLEGEEINYKVRGGQDANATLMVNEIDGEIFDSSEKARSALTDRATRSISKIVDIAVQKASEWYGPNAFEAPEGDVLATLKKQPEPIGKKQNKPRLAPPGEGTPVQLEDGTVVRVKMPDQLS